MEKTITHIVAVPSPWFSLRASVLELAKRLVQLHTYFHVTCLIPTIGSHPNASKSIVETLPPNITSIFLPPVHKEHLPQEAPTAAHVQLAVSLSLPSIHDALVSLSSSSRLVAIVADLFASDSLAFAKEFNILSFIYFPSAATTLSFCFYLPKLDDTVPAQFSDLPEPIEIPGCVPIHGRDLPQLVQDRSSVVYKLFLERCKQLRLADGVLVNSFPEMETGPIRALIEEGTSNGIPPVYPVGPIIQTGSNGQSNGTDCLRWLDTQAPNSVLYVSFGSGGTLSQDQLKELALGLEKSNQKFLWAVRAPSESANTACLGAENEDPLQFLPFGFLERTNDQGLMVPYWAPQVEILSHSATGGFLSHCGWNSILESVVNGITLIAWPLFAEQRMNAVMLTNGLKVALRPKVNETGIVEGGEVARVVKSLMEGEEGRETRRNVKDLKDAAANALKENGSSAKTLSELAIHLRGK